jgi:anti-sigma factor RsiW
VTGVTEGEPAGPGPHIRSLLGAYVLRALTPEEHGRVAAHLNRCGRCAAAYAEVADAPALLAFLEEEDLL